MPKKKFSYCYPPKLQETEIKSIYFTIFLIGEKSGRNSILPKKKIFFKIPNEIYHDFSPRVIILHDDKRRTSNSSGEK